MNKVEIYQIYTSKDKESNFWYLRPQIHNLLESAKTIERFKADDLPQDVVIDNVYSHTKRTLLLSRLIPMNPTGRALLQLTLILHDLPEVQSLLEVGMTSDITSPQKEANTLLDNRIAEKELEIARRIFIPQELELYKTFEESGNYLKGKNYNINYLSKIGIFAQLLDKIDANLKLHLSISDWFNSVSYDPTKILPELSVTYAFRQYTKFKEKLEKLEDRETSIVGVSLLQSQMEVIRKLWK